MRSRARGTPDQATGSAAAAASGQESRAGDLELLLAARHLELPVRNPITVAAAVDFAGMGLFTRLFSDGRLDADALIDARGNVPGRAFRQLVQMMRDNAIVNDTVLLSGKPVHMMDIRYPFLSTGDGPG